MADFGSKLRLQYAHATDDLNYGHLGSATYLEHAREWTYLRKPTTEGAKGNAEHEDRETTSAFPYRLVNERLGTIADTAVPETTESKRSVTSRTGIKAFLKHLPDVVPALSQVKQDSLAKEPRDYSPQEHRPNSAERIAFGSAVRLLEGGRNKGDCFVPIAAVVGGQNSDSVRLVRIGRERVDVIDQQGIEKRLVVPHISKQDESWWTGSGEQVEQLCFAATAGYASAWLAVRQRSATTILHPLLHRKPVPSRGFPHQNGFQQRPGSLLDSNPALSLPISRTGGFPHADVAFHPQDHRTIALIDEHGNWSIWYVQGKEAASTRVSFRIHLQKSGKLYSWQHQRRPVDVSPYYDGWHKILWLGRSTHEADSLLVCNRQSAVLRDASGKTIEDVYLRLGPMREGQWILDVKKSTVHLGRCFVLTSTRLLLMSAAEEDIPDSASNTALVALCSWHHFRGRADTTLRLSVIETHQSAAGVIYSRENSFVSAFRIGLDSELSPLQRSLADPVQVHIPRYNPVSLVEDLEALLTFRQVDTRQYGDVPGDSPAMALMKLFVQHSDTHPTEHLYQHLEPGLSYALAAQSLHELPLPSTRDLAVSSSKYVNDDDLDDFLGEQEDEYRGPEADARTRQILRLRMKAFQGVAGSTSKDLSTLYDLIVDGENLPGLTEAVDMTQAIQQIQRYLEGDRELTAPLFLLTDAIHSTPKIGDVDKDSAALAFALANILDGRGGEVCATSLLRRPAPEVSSSTFVEVYNDMVRSWVTSVPRELPDRIRVNKERLARSLTASLVLAGTSIRRSFPIRQSDGIASAQSNATFHDVAFSDQTVPSFPPQTSSPQAFTASPQEDPACTRLRTLTVLTKPIPPILTSSALSDMLSHIPASISANPSTYSWRATELSLAAGHAEAAALTLDPKARRQAEKRAEIQRRKLQTQQRITQAVARERGEVPMVLDTQVLPVREVQSSQLRPESQEDVAMPSVGVAVTMTQPERGAFGTRTEGKGKAKAKKNVRKPGF